LTAAMRAARVARHVKKRNRPAGITSYVSGICRLAERVGFVHARDERSESRRD
jgi:hypothetical protein